MAVLLSVATTSLSPPPTPPARFGKSYGWQFRAASWKPGALAPDYLDGTLAADEGCDVLCLAPLGRKAPLDALKDFVLLDTEARQKLAADMSEDTLREALQWMREAEIKHARLAMLAVVGWPLAELVNPWSLGTTGGRAPSLFNGGLLDGPITPFLLVVLGATAYLEVRTQDQVNGIGLPAEYVPGDLKFDPLGYYTIEGPSKKKELQRDELYNGRLAMLAITGFAVQEFLYSTPVIEQTPFFFGK